MTHGELVDRAVRWLRGAGGCSVVFAEFMGVGVWEKPDAIGFSCWGSALIECKVSRSDFRHDAEKPFRRNPSLGMGARRYFMVPEGLVGIDEIPDGWGMLYVKSRHVRKVLESKGFPDRARCSEMSFLVAMLRRAQLRIDKPLNEWLRMEQPVGVCRSEAELTQLHISE